MSFAGGSGWGLVGSENLCMRSEVRVLEPVSCSCGVPRAWSGADFNQNYQWPARQHTDLFLGQPGTDPEAHER